MGWLTKLFGGESDTSSEAARCAVCGKRLEYRTVQKTVRRMLDRTRGIERIVSVTQSVCPKCNVVYDADVHGDLRRVEQELEEFRM